jgi:hypothetical protein
MVKVSRFKDVISVARGEEPEAEPEVLPVDEVKPGKSKVKLPGRTEVKQQAEIELTSSKRGGKSSNNDYKQSTIYVRKDLHKKVIRLLEDDDYPGDFSDWVEEMMLNLMQTQQQAKAED